MKKKVLIIGAGIAGLSAALEAAVCDAEVLLVSEAPSERAGSVMAEGGINGALNTKGENDTVHLHFEETFTSGRFLGDLEAIRGMTEAAPDIIRRLNALGVQFNTDTDGNIDLRSFGGQKKKRTAFAGSETGKQIMTALIDAARRFECDGKIKRFNHHSFNTICFSDDSFDRCIGCEVKDIYTGEKKILLADACIIASGGMHGIFKNTTGSAFSTGYVCAELYRIGLELINPEMIQYHPTTVESGGKRMLISEAARGEGGRLYTIRDGKKIYFMEEKYPELGNLMPRDVTSREIWRVINEKKTKVFLDMSHLDDYIFDNKLFGLEKDCLLYLGIDIRSDPIEVEPGIHYFMGGIRTDIGHKTKVKGLYAAGECAALYHGANRLGGNSLLGAFYGGQKAADSALKYLNENNTNDDTNSKSTNIEENIKYPVRFPGDTVSDLSKNIKGEDDKRLKEILCRGLGVIRSGEVLKRSLDELEGLRECMDYEHPLFNISKTILMAADLRMESRGAHFRDDFPEEDKEIYDIEARMTDDQINIKKRVRKISIESGGDGI